MPFDIATLLGGAGAAKLVRFFRKDPDLAPCNTRIERGGKGWPWDDKVAIHTTADGMTEIKLVRGKPHP